MAVEHSILWRRLDQPGHEFARLCREDAHWHLTGTAVFVQDALPCRLDYHVVCDGAWETLSGSVDGWVGGYEMHIALSSTPDHRWWMDGTECPQVAGCVDLDLSFSPSTNLLPIRRLALAVGQAAEVQSAWLRFPGLTLAPLRQTYCRVASNAYRYEALDGAFTGELQVDEAGFVTDYPGLWTQER